MSKLLHHKRDHRIVTTTTTKVQMIHKVSLLCVSNFQDALTNCIRISEYFQANFRRIKNSAANSAVGCWRRDFSWTAGRSPRGVLNCIRNSAHQQDDRIIKSYWTPERLFLASCMQPNDSNASIDASCIQPQ